MRKTLTIILLGTLVLSLLNGCTGSEEAQPEEKTSRGENSVKEVEVFDLGAEIADIEFDKSGISSAETIASITPETSGRITEIKVKVNDKVKKGDVLFVLGESASTQIADIQSNTANKNLNISQKSENLTDLSANTTNQSATIAMQVAEAAHYNALQSRSNTIQLYELQYESALISLESAEDSYESAKDSYEIVLDIIDDMEDQLDDLEDDIDDAPDRTTREALEDAADQLEITIQNTEIQAESARSGMLQAKSGIDQSKNALAQLNQNYRSQLDQIEYSIETTLLQYESAKSQLSSTIIGGELQKLGADSQTLQAESNQQITGINSNLKYIKAPIDGTITVVDIEEGNYINPGQILAKVENNASLSVETALNEFEASLLKEGDRVKVESENEKSTGRIISISPSANSQSKKIDVEIEINSKSDIIPGSFVKITFSPKPRLRLFIPLNSVDITDDGKAVKYVNSKNIVKSKPVKTGEIIGKFIEITDGLKGDEKIIEAGTSFVEIDDEVKIIK